MPTFNKTSLIWVDYEWDNFFNSMCKNSTDYFDVYVDERNRTVVFDGRVGSLLGLGWLSEIVAVFMCTGNLEFSFISVIALMNNGDKMDQKCL